MRGDSSIEMYALLKEAGVKKVYFMSAWPPNFFHCNKGIDTPTDEELIAYRLIKDGTVKWIGFTMVNKVNEKSILTLYYTDPRRFE